ncbi:hypothetical protein SOCEGT47_079280 [Sorangium cellulosum]|uniref:Carboxypeptidase regulatory-like domain-containing protein n=1 Tax=Sorangium cellulosum TaxID=56 RepID=A0A4P2QD54_SORCE|nr:carboxypeptidase-like regulatory domain-containing protein [Sorangium cellulosum]AUX27341.1 hypothetical protein SOCEGT47_079280 [Sorangium cellulosum]
MSRRPIVRAALLASLPLAAACGIPLEALEVGPQNACDSSAECGPEATCASVGRQRACVATSASLEGLILEIRPGASRELGTEVSHLLFAPGGIGLPPHEPGGQVHSLDLQVPAPARVDATLSMGGSYCDGAVDGGAFPVRVEFRRVASFQGLPGQRYATISEPDGAGGQRFRLAIPTGNYHVYLIPQASGECDDTPPPIFLPNQRIPERWTPDIKAGAPEVLHGAMEVPQGVRVDGWKLDLVDALTGSVISQVGLLKHEPDLSLSPSRVDFSVKFYWTDKERSPLIRLRPKDLDPRPTVYWELAALALQGSTGNLDLSLLPIGAESRRVEGRTLDAEGNPVLAAVRIQSANLEMTQTAGFKLDTETDTNGLFQASLPPGEYVVFAQPLNDTTKAKGEQVLKVPAGDDCYCGQSVLIPEAGTLRGRVRGPAGEPMRGADVFAIPSTGEVSDYLGRVLGPDPLLPRQASGVLRGGGFSFGTDPGEFDFSVRPTPGSAYPWLVRPRLTVPAVASAVTALDLTVPYPAVLQGVIRDHAGARLGDAMVVAWLLVESETARGTVAGVIQIGEARSAPDGSYVLPLPPSTSR